MDKEPVENTDYAPSQYRSPTLYMILICGIILIIAGVILTILDEIAYGRATGTRLVPKDTKMLVTGPVTIGLGVLMSIFPAYQLIKKARNK